MAATVFAPEAQQALFCERDVLANAPPRFLGEQLGALLGGEPQQAVPQLKEPIDVRFQVPGERAPRMQGLEIRRYAPLLPVETGREPQRLGRRR